MSGFEAGVRADSRIGAAKFSHGNADARAPGVLIGRAHVAESLRRGNGAMRMAGALLVPLKLVLPVTLLLTILAAALVYAGMRLGIPGFAPWLTLGELLVPLAFLAIHITNRRYGAAYALAQVLGAWTIGIAAIWAARSDILSHPLPATRIVVAFAGALLVAQVAAVVVFDGLRGPRWWQAPLFASLWGSAILCVIGFPVAFAGSDTGWLAAMFDYLGVMIAASVLMVVPYWAIRGIVPPKSGFGGY